MIDVLSSLECVEFSLIFESSSLDISVNRGPNLELTNVGKSTVLVDSDEALESMIDVLSSLECVDACFIHCYCMHETDHCFCESLLLRQVHFIQSCCITAPC